jgi:hypothetical protein
LEEAEEKENDNSTLDNESEKGSEFALPEWLEEVQSDPSESMEGESSSDDEEEEMP